MKADLHIHSLYSPDAISRPDSIFEAALQRGIGIIAITDHDTTKGWQEMQEAAKKYPVQLVLGQEVKIFRDNQPAGELLCLFLEKPVKSHSAAEVIEEVRQQHGIVSIAHPFSERRSEFRAYTEIERWDDIAVEVRNGRTYNHRDNEMAMSLSERLRTPITAGSDAHTPFEVGKVYLEFDGSTVAELKQAILSRNVRPEGHSSSMLYSVLSGFGRIGVAV